MGSTSLADSENNTAFPDARIVDYEHTNRFRTILSEASTQAFMPLSTLPMSLPKAELPQPEIPGTWTNVQNV